MGDILLFVFPFLNVRAQSECEIEIDQGGGYSTTISSVTENGNGSHTIILNVKHNGCSGGQCKALAHFSVEAIPGTYSNVSIEVITGSFNYTNINMGPDLGGDPFSRFRLSSTPGFGNRAPGEFTITYTLTG